MVQWMFAFSCLLKNTLSILKLRLINNRFWSLHSGPLFLPNLWVDAKLAYLWNKMRTSVTIQRFAALVIPL
jgi:hypothetical protein